jgi:hypothetical protein
MQAQASSIYEGQILDPMLFPLVGASTKLHRRSVVKIYEAKLLRFPISSFMGWLGRFQVISSYIANYNKIIYIYSYKWT